MLAEKNLIPDEAAEALREHHKRQAAQRLRAGTAWQDNDLVFCTRNGTALAAGNVRRAFKAITKAAGLGGELDSEGTAPHVRLDPQLRGHSAEGIVAGPHAGDSEGAESCRPPPPGASL